MYEIIYAIPDVDVLLGLEPEELGAKLLFLLRDRTFPRDMFMPEILSGELWPQSSSPGHKTAYPLDKRSAVEMALTEAWVWLEVQGLIVPAAGTNGRNGWRLLSWRVKRFSDQAAFAQYSLARTLPKDTLHPRIGEKAWMAFARGEFDVAVFQTMKAVEVAVREAAGLSQGTIGVALMREAFSTDRGPLTDLSTEKGEQVARMELFAGAIGSYKNPHSHRDVNLNNPAEALEIIMLANHLLRIVDCRVAARQNGLDRVQALS